MHIKTERQCISCRNRFLKKDLIRISNGASGVIINDTKKINGRAVYVCKNEDCINKVCKKKLLNKAFSTAVADEIYINLRGNIWVN